MSHCACVLGTPGGVAASHHDRYCRASLAAVPNQSRHTARPRAHRPKASAQCVYSFLKPGPALQRLQSRGPLPMPSPGAAPGHGASYRVEQLEKENDSLRRENLMLQQVAFHRELGPVHRACNHILGLAMQPLTGNANSGPQSRVVRSRYRFWAGSRGGKGDPVQTSPRPSPAPAWTPPRTPQKN